MTVFSPYKSKYYTLFPTQNYFGDAWNVFDFIIVLGSFIDIVYSEVNVSEFDLIRKNSDVKGKNSNSDPFACIAFRKKHFHIDQFLSTVPGDAPCQIAQ